MSYPKPILRKEVVETQTWGELCVKQILLEDRITLQVREKPPEDETELDRSKRFNREYTAFLSELLALCVVDRNTDEPPYTVHDWKVWLSTNDSDQQPAVQADLMKLTNKSLAMNNYKVLGGDGEAVEDVAKND